MNIQETTTGQETNFKAKLHLGFFDYTKKKINFCSAETQI